MHQTLQRYPKRLSIKFLSEYEQSEKKLAMANYGFEVLQLKLYNELLK